MDAFICKNIGQNDSGQRVEKLPDGRYRAFTRITHVFGDPIGGGDLEGFGATEDEATAALEQEINKFNDSLWI